MGAGASLQEESLNPRARHAVASGAEASVRPLSSFHVVPVRPRIVSPFAVELPASQRRKQSKTADLKLRGGQGGSMFCVWQNQLAVASLPPRKYRRSGALGRISTLPPISPSPRDGGAGRGAVSRF